MFSRLEDIDPRLAARLAVNPQTGCWEFQGYLNQKGYGLVGRKGKMWRVHRYVFQLLAGPLIDGLQLDHLCRVRHCANPCHLEQVTAKTNVERAEKASGQRNAHKTHCPQGHPYTGRNLIREEGRRRCRKCQRLRKAKREARQRQNA